MATVAISVQELAALAPQHDFFVGIDSDDESSYAGHQDDCNSRVFRLHAV